MLKHHLNYLLFLHAMFNSIVSVLLTAIILLAEAGQMVYAHTCFKSNETSFSLYAPAHCNDEKTEKSCCEKKQRSRAEECINSTESCCGISAKYVQQSFPARETEWKNPSIVKQVVFAVVPFLTTYFSAVSPVAYGLVSSSPPLLFSYSSFLCVFRC